MLVCKNRQTIGSSFPFEVVADQFPHVQNVTRKKPKKNGCPSGVRGRRELDACGLQWTDVTCVVINSEELLIFQRGNGTAYG